MRWPIIAIVSTLALVSARDAKWFFPRATVTRYVKEEQIVTEIVPSSCVVLETSLKPCRHLRQIQPTATSTLLPKMVMTASPRLEGVPVSPPALSGSRAEPEVGSQRSWSSYLGLSPVTILRTVTQLVTARAALPAAVVTFSVRGCQPSRLPFGLPLCSEPNTTTTTTATATARISTTKDVHYVEE